MYHSAIAILSSLGVETPTSHRGLTIVFSREIVTQGILGREFARMLSGGHQQRMGSAYNPRARVTREDAVEAVENARRFVAAVRSELER
jgi:uncharacterized protein (UPF0332 family)